MDSEMSSSLKKKRVLFLSAIDFKQKSIAVIQKTPEAYIEAGWEVDYVVARDDCKRGNYFYEEEINPKGVNVHRFRWPFSSIRNKTSGLIYTIVSKLASFRVVNMLSRNAQDLLEKNSYDIIYGYEIQGVLAVSKLRKKKLTAGIPVVSRFQGTWLALYLKNKRRLKLLLNFDGVKAMQQPADLCIMTDDGTMGNYAVDKLTKPGTYSKFCFWPNGVDDQFLPKEDFEPLIERFKSNGEFVFLTVSRLESWKRLDRVLSVFEKAVNQENAQNLRLVIVGEGSQRESLEKMSESLGLKDQVHFVGSVERKNVSKYLNMSDAFISMYDLSNVGNPLLEAIRAHKVIFTLNNGDTASWIKHRENGFIYDLVEGFEESAARDFVEVAKNSSLRNEIQSGVKATAETKLWTWDERMSAEVGEVEALLDT